MGRNKEWEFYNNEILSHFKEGKKAFSNAKKQLIDYGYLVIIGQNHKEDGSFGGNDYEIYAEPQIQPHTQKGNTLEGSALKACTLKGVTNNKDTNKTDLNKKDTKQTASGSHISIQENSNATEEHNIKTPVIRESLITQSKSLDLSNSQQIHTFPRNLKSKAQKQEEEIELIKQFQKFWIIYKETTSNIDFSKPNKSRDKAFKLYKERVDETSCEYLMQSAIDYLDFKKVDRSPSGKMGIEVFLGGKCNDDFRDKVNRILKNTGKQAPLPQKSPEIQQEEQKASERLQQLRNAKIQALKREQIDFMENIRKVLKSYFSEFHLHWINDFIFAKTSDCGVFGFTNAKNLDSFDQQQTKILEIVMRETSQSIKSINGKVLEI